MDDVFIITDARRYVFQFEKMTRYSARQVLVIGEPISQLVYQIITLRKFENRRARC